MSQPIKQPHEIDRLTRGLAMPEKWYRGEYSNGKDNDGEFVMEQLARLTWAQRAKAVLAYDEVFEQEGRYAANTRLRAFADRCEKANQGRTEKEW